MRKRIFFSITGVTLIALMVFSFFNSVVTYNQIFDKEKINIKKEFLQIKTKLLSQSNGYDFSILFTPYRVTVINTDGDVLFDNKRDFMTMDNHSDREEIILLNTQKSSASIRLSDTLGKQTYYYAEKLDDTTILRLSITVDTIYGIIRKITPVMIVVVILIVIFSALISSFLAKKIVAPLFNIDEPMYDELDLFYQKIRGQSRQIKKQNKKLRIVKEEIKILSKNIGNGFILLGENNKVAMINKLARNIFGTKESNFLMKDAFELNRSPDFITAIEKAYEGKNSEIWLVVNNKEYFLHISSIKNEKKDLNKIVGVLIIVIDNTEKAQAEKIRKEFSANVSHELKTPLTSILGYAEIMKNGLAKTEDVQRFCNKIFEEATNLLELIDDILKISRLDEVSTDFNWEDINLATLIESIINRLDIVAQKKNVEIKTDLENIQIHGIKSILDETFYNVIENAIKYNVDNGIVLVELSQTSTQVVIRIKDSGIGIPQDSIKRVFERFYRVDKSHSSTIKGTGLGLSIVKHAVNLHEGKIDIKSELQKGTKVKILLPKK